MHNALQHLIRCFTIFFRYILFALEVWFTWLLVSGIAEVKTCSDFNIKCIFLSSGSLVVSNVRPICITTDLKYPVPLLLSALLLLVHGCFLKTTSWSEMSSRASSIKSKFQARNGGKGSGRWRACIIFFILCIWGLCRHGTLTCLHFTRQKLVSDAFSLQERLQTMGGYFTSLLNHNSQRKKEGMCVANSLSHHVQ